MAVGTGRLLAAGLAADLGPAVLLEPLAEHDVVGHDEPVDAGLVGDARGVEQGLPGSGILGRRYDVTPIESWIIGRLAGLRVEGPAHGASGTVAPVET